MTNFKPAWYRGARRTHGRSLTLGGSLTMRGGTFRRTPLFHEGFPQRSTSNPFIPGLVLTVPLFLVIVVLAPVVRLFVYRPTNSMEHSEQQLSACPSRIFGGGRVLCFVKRIYLGRGRPPAKE